MSNSDSPLGKLPSSDSRAGSRLLCDIFGLLGAVHSLTEPEKVMALFL